MCRLAYDGARLRALFPPISRAYSESCVASEELHSTRQQGTLIMKATHETLQISVSLELVNLQAWFWVSRTSYWWAQLRKDGTFFSFCCRTTYNIVITLFISYAGIFHNALPVTTVVFIYDIHCFTSPTRRFHPHLLISAKHNAVVPHGSRENGLSAVP